MRAQIARDLQRMGDRADWYVQEAAQRHGICMERATFRMARCQEIWPPDALPRQGIWAGVTAG